VVEEDEGPPDGAVVVALLKDGEEVKVKRLYTEANRVRLRPENGDHEELVVYVVHPPGKRA
jgi:repressor LexA